MTLLALVLAVWTFAHLLLLSVVVTMPTQENMSQSRFGQFSFSIHCLAWRFVASAYGLWNRRNWGRLLFIGCVIVWGGFYVVSLFTPDGPVVSGNYTLGTLALNIIAYVGGTFSIVLYLNLPHIKALFDTQEAANERMNK